MELPMEEYVAEGLNMEKSEYIQASADWQKFSIQEQSIIETPPSNERGVSPFQPRLWLCGAHGAVLYSPPIAGRSTLKSTLMRQAKCSVNSWELLGFNNIYYYRVQ
jgi:hypothetical protein